MIVPKIIVLAVIASFIAISYGQISENPGPDPRSSTEVPTTTKKPTPTTEVPTSTETPTSSTTKATTSTSKPTPPPPTNSTTPAPEPHPTTSTTQKTTTSSTTVKPSSTSSAPPTTPKPSPKPAHKPDVGNWNVTDGNVTCILVDMAIQLNVSYPANGTEIKYAIMDVPKNINATGTCAGKTQLFNLTWLENGTKSELYLTFSKDEKEDKFMIGMINLTVMPNKIVFPGIQSNSTIKLFSNKTEFSTPISKSYKCEKEQTFGLEKEGSNNTVAKMTVSHVHLEAFHAKKDSNFGAVEDCEPSSSPDIVPIAVGCALVGLVAIVLVAYLVGRRRSLARGYLSM